ncbi:MAG: peptide-N-glycosidase F-related protein [Schleiferiaceae bacterium]|nr:peptide-N-glycosidase F-related protein [Schleiferiaceae bacterium]
MRYGLLLAFLLTLPALWAGPGDTTLVKAHQNVDMTWYEGYRAWAEFPDSTQSFHRIWLRYELGCATGGCSDWDYTTLVSLFRQTGRTDSAVKRIDTISQQPLVVDTIWRFFPQREKVELAKVITPYGGSLPQDWSRVFYFDVTDYYPLLRDSVELEVFYQGWSSGFSATLDFVMIEGTPPRKVERIDNLYQGKGDYITSSGFESQHQPPRQVPLHDSTQGLTLRNAPSGHGFVNALNCAEFCEKDYLVKVAGQTVARQAMWRSDCGANPVFPQAGTWLYDRANWCPGDRVRRYDHDLTPHLSGDTLQVDVDIEAYSYTVPSGEVPANYNLSTQLIQYGAFQHEHDLAVEAILQPSRADEYARLNPVCGQAQVVVSNRGGQSVSGATLHYGVAGNAFQFQQAVPELAPMEKDTLLLSMDSLAYWTSWKTVRFQARVALPAGMTDEVSFNNVQQSDLAETPVLPGTVELRLRTNNAPQETTWRLEDIQGNVLYSHAPTTPNTLLRDTFQLSTGCYRFIVEDSDEDGLTFFANNDGGGSIALRGLNGSNFYQSLPSDFGTGLRYTFTVGFDLDRPQFATQEERWEVYPQPAAEGFWLEPMRSAARRDIRLQLLSAEGRVLREERFDLAAGEKRWLSTEALAPGFYGLRLATRQGTIHKRVLVR